MDSVRAVLASLSLVGGAPESDESRCFPDTLYVHNPAVSTTHKYALACSLAQTDQQGGRLRARIICTHILVKAEGKISKEDQRAVSQARKLYQEIPVEVEPAYRDFKGAEQSYDDGFYELARAVLENNIFMPTDLERVYLSPETVIRATFLKAEMLMYGKGYQRDRRGALLLLEDVVTCTKNFDFPLCTHATYLIRRAR